MTERLPFTDEVPWQNILGAADGTGGYLRVAHNDDGSRKEVFDVKERFGAVGDFAHDDTAAIQAAIDAACAEDFGGVVYFPAGVYLISSTLTVRTNNIILRGTGNGYPFSPAGGGSNLYASGAFSGTYMIDVGLPSVPTNGLRGFRMDGLAVNGGGVDVGGVYADTQQGYFTHSQFISLGYNALWLDTSAGIGGTGNYNNVVSDCFFEFVGQYSHGGDAIRVESTDDKIIDNWFYGFYNDCIGMRGPTATHLQVYGNHIDALTSGGAVGGAGIYADNCAGLEVVGNAFSRCRGGIKIENTAIETGNLHITDNSFSAPETDSDDNTFDAIYIANANTVYGALISDNTFFNSGFGPYVKWRYGVNIADAKMKNLIIGSMSDQISLAGAVSAFGTAPIKDTGSFPQVVSRIIKQSAVQTTHTGDTNTFTLATVTVPAMTMGLNGRIRIIATFGKVGTANTADVTATFGGTLVFFGIMSATSLSSTFHIEVCNRNSLSSQVTTLTGNAGWGNNTNAVVTAAINTGADVTVLLQGDLADASDTVTLESYTVEVLPG